MLVSIPEYLNVEAENAEQAQVNNILIIVSLEYFKLSSISKNLIISSSWILVFYVSIQPT
jgi:hypothetical protein